MTEPGQARHVDDIDWSTWQPKDRATLLFVIRDGRVLLIRKKRGLGAGKINGPGGRLDPGETPLQAAIRETQEEVCITPRDVTFCGELSFQFVDGYSIHGYVFRASRFDGEPCSTEEADPLWFSIDEMPYAEMWADDEYWFPLLLEGTPFRGRFLFDADRMLSMAIAREPDSLYDPDVDTATEGVKR